MSVYEANIELTFPAHLPGIANTLENTPGVYIFFDKQHYPLYIGKSNQVKSRVLSHYREFGHVPRKTKLILQTDSIKHYPTAGSFTALFKEAELIKKFLPLYNKRLRQSKNYYTIKINTENKVEFCQGIDLGDLENHYGIFANLQSAKETLIQLTEKTPLCKQLCGLSSTAPCFSHQLNRCQRSCGAIDFKMRHRHLLETHLAELRLKHWPYPGHALAIKETHLPTDKTQYILLYQWCYLGLAEALSDIPALLQEKKQRKFDKNYYQLSVALFSQMDKYTSTLFPIDVS